MLRRIRDQRERVALLCECDQAAVKDLDVVSSQLEAGFVVWVCVPLSYSLASFRGRSIHSVLGCLG